MEFEDNDAFKDWLKTQSQEVCVSIACRAALRVFPIVAADGFWKDSAEARAAQQSLVILTAWCSLISGVAVSVPTPEIKKAASRASYAAAADASSADRASYAANAASRASYAASRAASDAASDAASYASHAASYAASYAASDAAFRAAYKDAEHDVAAIFTAPLWHDRGRPEGLKNTDLSPNLLTDDSRFGFFRRWYDGMERGAPMDWELQRRVALIPQEVWTGDIDELIAEIAEIEDDWKAEKAGEDTRAPEFEPDNVVHLFDYPRSVVAQVSFSSVIINQSVAEFRREVNHEPEVLKPLEKIPALLDQVEALIEQGRSDATEQALRETIGRLNAMAAKLELSLKTAKDDPEIKETAWIKKLAYLSTAVLATTGAVWTLSGDDLGPKKRCEMISEYFEFITGRPLTCDRRALPEAVVSPTLPQSVDT